MAGKKRKKNPFRRCLVWTFWLSLLFTLGFTWYYVERKVPDHLSVVVDEKEEFDFALPFQATAKRWYWETSPIFRQMRFG